MPKREVRIHQFVPHRDAYILSQCRDKQVLHIGAADWPFTQEKYDNNSLLYKKIDAIASKQLGIDNDAESVAFLNSVPFRNSKLVLQDFNTIQNTDFEADIIIFGETLEHLMNLEVALSNLKQYMHKDTSLVVSVPNATYALNFLYALFGAENQHPDHSVAFTYKTLKQLLEKNKFHIEEFSFTSLSGDTQRLNWKGKIGRVFGRVVGTIFPMLAPNLLVLARKRQTA